MWLRTLRCVSSAPTWSSLVVGQSPLCPPSVLFHSPVRLLSSSSDKSKLRTEVFLNETDLQESFVKGSGKGGQKINKVRNCVLLTHLPTGFQVQCQKTRSLDGNRRAARKLMLQKLDDHVNGSLSKRNQKIERLRRKKSNRRAKSKQKYAKTEDTEENKESEDEEEDDEEEDDDEDEDEEFIDLEEHRFKSKKKTC